MEESELKIAEAELTEARKLYDTYLKHGLIDKARHSLPRLNLLEGRVAELKEE